MMIEQTCKTNGAFMKKLYPNFNEMVKSTLNQYPEFRSSILDSIKRTPNFINELMRYSQDNEQIRDKVSLVWFKKFLHYILNCAKHGIHLAKQFISKILGVKVSEGAGNIFQRVLGGTVYGFALNVISIGTTILAIVSAVVLLAISLWMEATGRIVRKLRSKPSLIERIRDKATEWFGTKEDDLPEDLTPPDLDVPNVTMSFNVGSLKEGMFDSVADNLKGSFLKSIEKIFYILCLKAVLSSYMVPGLATGVALTGLFLPNGFLMTFLLLTVFLGCGGIASFSGF